MFSEILFVLFSKNAYMYNTELGWIRTCW